MNTTTTKSICPEHQHCPACQLWPLSQEEEKHQKINHLASFIQIKPESIQYLNPCDRDFRERMDFTLQNEKIGFLKAHKEFIEIKECHIINPLLKKAFQILKTYPINVKIGSIRIRTSSFDQNLKPGLWLDLANVDIKKLLDEKKLLLKLSEHFFIEIGQKKKVLIKKNSTDHSEEIQLKLADPDPQPWFQTTVTIDNNKIQIPLFCSISNFTQPSHITAQSITDEVRSLLTQLKINSAWEFGSGIGQYTMTMLSQNIKLTAFEIDHFANECIKKSLTFLENQTSHINLQNFNLIEGDLQNKIDDYLNLNEKPDLILVNPPKSGLKKFSDLIIHHKPKHIIYISCFTETLARDAQKFKASGYQIGQTTIVNQFPHTNHYESIVLFSLIEK